MIGLSQTVADSCRTLREASHERLAAGGSLCTGSGVLAWNGGRLDLHTDFGPPDQDKEGNQDFVLAWVPHQPRTQGLRWAVALADGVTSSYHAEVAAEVACWSGLAAVVGPETTPAERARAGIDAAGQSIGALADLIEDDADAHRPDGEFESSWRYTVREGLLLQTTLTLAWLEGNRFCVAMVGDGGAVVELDGGAEPRLEVLAEADASTSQVHALGPRNRTVLELDCWREVEIDGRSRLALYTDGVCRGVQLSERSLFAESDSVCRADGGTNVAESLVRRWIKTDARAFEDNLTLVLVTSLGPEE